MMIIMVVSIYTHILVYKHIHVWLVNLLVYGVGYIDRGGLVYKGGGWSSRLYLSTPHTFLL